MYIDSWDGWLPFLILACKETAILILHLILIIFFTLQHSPYVDLGVVMFPFTFPMLENVTEHLDTSWGQ